MKNHVAFKKKMTEQEEVDKDKIAALAKDS